MIKKLYIMLFCFYGTIGYTQEHLYERISFKDGLPSSNLIDLATDNKGYLWITSTKGLFRYDGYNFLTLAINSNTAQLDISKEGILFTKDANGFYQLNTNSLTRKTLIDLNYFDADANNDHYNNVYIDHKNNIWTCDHNFIKKYNCLTKQLDTIKLIQQNTNSDFAHFMEDENHQLWVTAPNGLYKYNETQHTVEKVLDNYNFTCIAYDKNTLYLGTYNGELILFDILTAKTTSFALPVSSRINFITRENNGKFWLGTGDKMYEYDAVIYSIKEEVFLSKKGYQFRSATFDNKNKILWIATDAGILKHKIGIQNEIRKIDAPRDLVDYPVKINQYFEYQPNHFYLALSHSGILEWNATTNAFRKIPFASGNDKINNISLSANGELYASGYNGVYKLKGNSLEKIISSAEDIVRILVDRKQRLWVLPHGKEIEIYNTSDLRKIDIIKNKNKSELFNTNKFNDIVENKDGKIWLAAWYPKGYGICYYDELKKVFIEIADFNDHNLFNGDYYYNISLPARSSNIVFTGFGGIMKVKNNGLIYDALPTDMIIKENIVPTASQCLIDDDGHHWISSTEGLYFIPNDKSKIARITEFDGLTDNNISKGFTLSSDHKLLMSASNQIQILDIKNFGKNSTPPQLYLSAVTILGSKRKVNIDTSLTFDRNENNLSFDFTTLTYQNASQYNYQFRLAGNDAWISNGNSNNITFSDLDYGEHSFEVKVGDNLGNWSSKLFKISFYIKPKFYEQTTFKIFISVGIFSLLIGGIMYKFLLERKENEQKNKLLTLDAEKSRAENELTSTLKLLKSSQLDALRSQMNPHFIFNSLNSIENFILKNEKIIASEYLGKFSKLIRNILDNSKSEQIPIAKEIETLKLYVALERLRTGDAFDVHYDIPNNILEDNINIPPMLMQPHVENAILHGIKHLENKRGHLNISMTINNDDYLEYTLQDNGIGRAKSKAQKTYRNHEHKSYGIDITQNRIDLYNQKNNVEISFFVEDLYDSNLIACGTKVVVFIPII